MSDFDDETVSGAAPILQEALGVTPSGNCLRHPNCPVLSMAHNKVMSCRICFTEEKSVGIQQRKNFASVVKQLQTIASVPDDDESSNKQDCRWADDDERRKAHQASMQSVLLYQSKQAQTLDSIMKRFSQVQNWILRQKEKEVLSLQLQIQRLEERLNDSEMTVVEQTQTVRALRRTIQQDLKIIKTMATQKEREIESGSTISRLGSVDNTSVDNDSFVAESTAVEDDRMEYDNGNQGRTSRSHMSAGSMSPLSVGSKSSLSPQKGIGNTSPLEYQNNRLQRQMDQLKRLNKHSFVEDEDAEASLMMGMKQYASIRNIENMTPICDGDGTGSCISAPHQERASSYWNDDDLSLAADPTKLFRSFRGGLLDIPKSPPPARHDDRPARQKLTLDSVQLDALKLPSMRSINQSNGSGKTLLPQQGIASVGLLSSEFTHVSPSPKSDLSNQKKSLSSEKKVPIHSPPKAGQLLPTLDLLGPTEDDEEDELEDSFTAESPDKSSIQALKATSARPFQTNDIAINNGVDRPEKYCFSVSSVDCHDKYGDMGKYSGSIHALENLPYGTGTMKYESGRVYSGAWVMGQWHGKGTLMNPNGDKYEGEFLLDARHGKGAYRWDNGDLYVGDFFEDKRHGSGKFSFHNGNMYEGEFHDGMFEGLGRYEFKGGFYDGEWKQGRYSGSGELKLANGGTYKGEFKNSVAHGFGTEIMADGSKRRGIWASGQPAEHIDCV
jgi:hypothetical protein